MTKLNTIDISAIPQNDLILIIFILVIVAVCLSLYIAGLREKKKQLQEMVTTYAGGVQRMIDFIASEGLIKEYQEYSLKKYGGKNE